MRFLLGLLLPTLLATANICDPLDDAPLLQYLKRTLASELSAIGANPLYFRHRHIYHLRSDLEALHDGSESNQLLRDYFGATRFDLEVNNSSETEPPTTQHRSQWATCEIRDGFLACTLSDVSESSAKVLVLLQLAVRWPRDPLELMHEDAEMDVRKQLYALRPLSQTSESRFLVCPDKNAHCRVEVHLRQIRSLSAFEAQLERIASLMDEIESEEIRRLEACRNLTCSVEAARRNILEKATSPRSEQKGTDDNQRETSTPPREVNSDADSKMLSNVLYAIFVVFCLLWSPLVVGILFAAPVYMTYETYRIFFK